MNAAVPRRELARKAFALGILAAALTGGASLVDAQREDDRVVEFPGGGYRTLQAAIDGVPDGGTVLIAAGGYALDEPLFVRGKTVFFKEPSRRALDDVLAAAERAASPVGTTDGWLRFRGPNGSGVAETTGVPAEFGPAHNLFWKTAVPFGRSSPIVAGNRIFLTASEGGKLITLCLDRRSGKVLWRRDAIRARHMPIYKGNDPASPTPVSDGTNVYVFFAELGLISYGPDGEERWRLPLGPFNSFYGIGASPVLASGTVVMVCDQRTNSYVIAVDARDGKVRWKISRSNPIEGYSTPVIYSPNDGEPQVLVFGSDALDAYDLNTGERVWWVGQVGYAPKGVPVLGREIVYVSAPGGDAPVFPPFDELLRKFDANGDGRIQAEEVRSDPYIYEHRGWVDSNGDDATDRSEFDLVRNASGAGHGLTAIRPGGKGNLTATNIAWRVKKGYPNVAAPLLYKDVLYMVKTGGIITSLDSQSGEVLKTGRSESAIEEYFSSPVAADNKVFIISESGKVTVLKAGGQWEILAVNDLDEEVWATPAIADGTIYIRTRNALYAFADARPGGQSSR